MFLFFFFFCKCLAFLVRQISLELNCKTIYITTELCRPKPSSNMEWWEKPGFREEMTSLKRRETLSRSVEQPNGSAHLCIPLGKLPGANYPQMPSFFFYEGKDQTINRAVQVKWINDRINFTLFLSHFLKLLPRCPQTQKYGSFFLIKPLTNQDDLSPVSEHCQR